MKLFGSMSIKNDELHIGEIAARDLAEIYGTPLYVFDEELIRDNCRKYADSMFMETSGNVVAYAGKAFLTKYMCKLINSEGLWLDVVSGGELFTAKQAEFPMEHILFHGNNKTLEEIRMGIEYGVGHFVVDNYYELENLQNICEELDTTQEIYFRVTPGIEAHTHDYIKTGQIDSKFGFTLVNGDLEKAVKSLEKYPRLKLTGLHAHIGSQIFEIDPYLDEVQVMIETMHMIGEKYGIELEDLDLGGGIGVYYTEEDKPKSIDTFCTAIIEKANSVASDLSMEVPRLIIEPGRSIVANAGSTLYTVGSIKEIEGVRTYVSVDGGMTDNVRPSLYGAGYECAVVNKLDSKNNNKPVTIAGKCCESGDILISDTKVSNIESGDILITASTGAYGYSMASNYNKIPKAAAVSVYKGESQLISRRQTYEELIELEL